MATVLDLERGDPVKVHGERGKFTFAYVRYTKSGELDSICVHGGTAGHETYRFFTIDRVSPIRKRRGVK